MRLQVPVLKAAVLTLVTAFVVWGCCSTTETVLNIGPGAYSGLTCPDGTDAALGCNQSLNPVPANHMDIYLSGGSGTFDIQYLIIGIPLSSGVSSYSGVVPHISSVATYNPYSTSGTPIAPSAVNFADRSCGVYTSGSVYARCGVAVANNGGNTVGNWLLEEDPAQLGFSATKFALYSYNLSSLANLGVGGLYEITFSGNLPVGTIEVAYGCATGANGACSGVPEYCVVTGLGQAGQVSPVPEPSSLYLVAGASLLLIGFSRRRKKKSQA